VFDSDLGRSQAERVEIRSAAGGMNHEIGVNISSSKGRRFG
jgi:hypothetical protein